MIKCNGCGVILQSNNKNEIGYTSNLNNSLCERCFRIRNYNDYKIVVKDNNDYIKILKDIDKTNDLVILVVDLFNINKNLEDISKYINNDILLVLTKRDLLPLSCYEEKLKNYFDNYKFNIIDKIIISSKKNYNLDELYYKINYHKKSDRVYVVGFTNSGKSSMINKIIYNYSLNDFVITTSNLPSTTIDSIEIKVNDNLTLIDTPGLLDDMDIINYVDKYTLKKIIPVKEINPIAYQIKTSQTIIIENLFRIDIEGPTNIIIYASNNLDIQRYYKDIDKLKDLKEMNLEINESNDLVIQGLGFIKFTHNSTVKVYIKNGVRVFTRKSLI